MKFMRYKGTISDNTGNEFVHIKRLGQIIVSAGARPAHLIADLVLEVSIITGTGRASRIFSRVSNPSIPGITTSSTIN